MESSYLASDVFWESQVVKKSHTLFTNERQIVMATS